MNEENNKDIKRFIYQNVRPRKSAFIIRNGDWAALEKAVKISTLAWGGIFNLMLITENEAKISDYNQKLINILDPDCLYVMSKEDIKLIDILDQKGYEVSKIKDITEYPSISPIGILINSVFENREEEKQEIKKPRLMYPAINNSVLKLSYLLKYGFLISEEEKEILRNFNVSPLNSLESIFKIEKFENKNTLEEYIDSIISNRLGEIENESIYDPLSLTKWKVHWEDSIHHFNEEDFHKQEISDDRRSEIIFVFMKNDNFRDFALAWNLQAVRPFFNFPVTPFPLLIPFEIFEKSDFGEILKKINNTIYKLNIQLNIPFDPSVYAISDSIETCELKDLVKNFDIKIISKNNFSIFREEFKIGVETTTIGIYDGFKVDLNTPKIPHKVFKGNYSIDIAAEKVIVPRKQNVRKYFPFGSFNSRSSKYGITFKQDIDTSSTVLSVLSPRPFEILSGYASSRNFTVNLSESGILGRISQLLIQEERLHRLKIISNKNVYHLLNEMKRVVGRGLYERWWNDIIKSILINVEKEFLIAEDKNSIEKALFNLREETIKKIESATIKDREHFNFGRIKEIIGLKNKEDAKLILKWLLDKHICERLVNLKCQVCNREIFIKTDELNEEITCPICYKKFRFINPESELNWYYRMTESWAKIQNADIFPSLLTLLYFEFKFNERPYIDALSGGWTGVEFSPKIINGRNPIPVEVDVVAFVYRELVLGESKMKSKEFITKKGINQIKKLIRLSLNLDSNYLVFSSLDNMSKEIRNQITDLTQTEKYNGKLIFLDEEKLFNQEAVSMKNKNTLNHLEGMVSFIKYWESRKEENIF
jgi:hypothetical protein